MVEATQFEKLIRLVRSGDQEAARELVQRYEPSIRRAVRYRLGDGHLNAVFDSMDICQSVLASFFFRAASGEYEITNPGQLLHLLSAMARNKLAHQIRKQRAQCRDHARQQAVGQDADRLASATPSPSRQLEARELLEEAGRRLSAEERQLVEMRQQGMDWQAIAAQVGGTAEGVRKRLSRALDRVAQELGLDEG
jgi:RNA polymerase sigma factor (sigma-70 family)